MLTLYAQQTLADPAHRAKYILAACPLSWQVINSAVKTLLSSNPCCRDSLCVLPPDSACLWEYMIFVLAGGSAYWWAPTSDGIRCKQGICVFRLMQVATSSTSEDSTCISVAKLKSSCHRWPGCRNRQLPWWWYHSDSCRYLLFVQNVSMLLHVYSMAASCSGRGVLGSLCTAKLPVQCKYD